MLMTTTGTDGLGDLPVELELAILAQLPLSALPSLACVCRRWQAHLNHLDFIHIALRAHHAEYRAGVSVSEALAMYVLEFRALCSKSLPMFHDF